MKKILKKLLTGMIFFLLVKITTAQDFHVATGNVDVTDGTILEINGSFKTDAGTVVKNENSTIRLTGDFNVDPAASYTSTGTEEFFGSTDQTIYPISGTSYLSKIEKNNFGKLIVFGTVDCDSVTWLTDGLIDLTSAATIRIKSGTVTAIAGYGPLRYFDVDDDAGSVSRYFNTANVLYVFPIGNSVAGYYRFDIFPTTLGTTGNNFVTTKIRNGPAGTIDYHQYFTTGFSGNFPGQDCVVGTNAQLYELTCMTDNIWNVDGPADYESIVYGWGPTCDPFGNSPRRILRSPPTIKAWLANITDVVGILSANLCLYSNFRGGITLFIPGGIYRGFGEFASAGGEGAVLPIELLSLTVSGLSESILVQWITASELNNDYFNVQRSTDGIHWVTIGQIDGHGTTEYRNEYFYEDKNVVPNVRYYYRLEQVDFDRSLHYSNIVQASIAGGMIQNIILYPNPTTGAIHSSLVLQQVTVFNLLGEKIRDFSDVNDFDISDISAGTYLFVVTIADGFTKTFKITKK